jgi:hypothetical protein
VHAHQSLITPSTHLLRSGQGGLENPDTFLFHYRLGGEICAYACPPDFKFFVDSIKTHARTVQERIQSKPDNPHLEERLKEAEKEIAAPKVMYFGEFAPK